MNARITFLILFIQTEFVYTLVKIHRCM